MDEQAEEIMADYKDYMANPQAYTMQDFEDIFQDRDPFEFIQDGPSGPGVSLPHNVSGSCNNIVMKKEKKPQKIANTAYIVAMRELRRSNASGTHDNRPNRQRTRSAIKLNSIKEFS